MTTAKADQGEAPVRVLILDDEPWDAELAQRLLARSGDPFAFVVVATRDAFTEQLAAFQPDVIISDFSLPGFTGVDALKIAQEQCPEVPVIIWSGVLGDEAAVELIKQGAADYVLKDRPARLPAAVGSALTLVRQRSRLARIEERLGQAQRLASLGRLVAAEQAVTSTRQMLAAARRQLRDGEPGASPKVPPNA